MKTDEASKPEQRIVTADTQLVSGGELLEILFPPKSRPTLRWLRDQTKARRIGFVKIGRLVFFSPSQVRSQLGKQRTMGGGLSTNLN